MILVIGDIILDKYSYGSIERINPEVPVPVIHVKREEYVLGGAANVALNCLAMGSDVQLIGSMGKDFAALKITELAMAHRLPLHGLEHSGLSTVKQRFVSQEFAQQILRADFEQIAALSQQDVERIRSLVQEARPKYILLADYGKGVISDDLVTTLLKLGIPLLVDPKPKNMTLYKGVHILKPNRKELEESFGKLSDEALKECAKLMDAQIVCTLGSEGAVLATEKEVTHFSARKVEVIDVCGAGDTFIACLAAQLDQGVSLKDAVRTANLAASIAVSKKQTAIVSKEELANAEERL
ncbi:MAG: bifunctional heptose 7-phosphate kinase/heptose 1-phosphate adenyltransferase [Nitrosarchaeum sp.]|nr:bifunctional heptose 7-phosphate kinase/heptose 1-phosphate adenyltransferase [Nitrosarchaeum sp.]